MRPKIDSELSWTAFRYVCGELNADEAAAFEQRLDQEQAAREAVAEAVEVAGAVARLDADTPLRFPGPRRVRRRALARWVALAAASVLLALAVKGLWLASGDREPARGRPAPSALALAWSGVHEDEDETDNLLEWLDTAPAPADVRVVAALDASDAGDGVPDWMVAAAALDGDTSGAQPDRKEN